MVKKKILYNGILILFAATLLSLAGYFTGGLQNDEGRTGKVSPQADKVRCALDNFLLSTPTSGVWETYVPEWTNRFENVRRDIQGVQDALFAVPDGQARFSLLREAADRILDGVVARTNGWEELDYYRGTRLMLDTLAAVGWEMTRDGDFALALWSRQRRRYEEAHGRCVKEEQDIKSEYRRNRPKVRHLMMRMAMVRATELTKEEVAFREWWSERVAYWEKRGYVLERLLAGYSHWDVGEHGRKLDGGRLYERFKSLTPEQLREIENRVRMSSCSR